ncbi:MAG: hypothetical protein ABIS48_03080 [Candidatus Saccharimonadales bacterium]
MKKDMYPNQSLIKQDMLEVLSTALELVFERFDIQDKEIADVKAIAVRTENKLDPTIEKVDAHTMQLAKLETRLA